ncbi:transcriptional regulator, MarR family [Mesorhizobium sp. YR577]|nr:transcriptional regulator, MarR family [Mesorhizobium sp. YR577]
MQMKFSREKSAGYLTNWAARLFAKAIDRRLKELGLSSGQLPVFFALGDGGAMSQKALTEIAAIEQPTMAATLSRMERDGIVARAPNPEDGRSALFSLTPSAMKKALDVRAAIATVNADALEGLEGPDREAFLAMLRGVIANLENRLNDQP